MTKQTSNKFSPEVRERAVRMVLDHALAETVIGLFKTEVIHRRGPMALV